MINKNEYTLRLVCKNYEMVENFKKAVNDFTQKYHLHHRKEITENKSREELIEENQYFNVSPDDLIFLTASEHIRLHNKGSKKPHSQ